MICVVHLLPGPPLDQLIHRQQCLQQAALATSTRSSHLSQINCYFRFCSRYGLVSFPCSAEQSCLYAAFLCEWMTPASIVNYLSALWHRQKSLDYDSHSSSWILQQTMRGLKRCFSSTSSPRHPLSVGDLRLIFTGLNTLLPLDLVFWAAVTLAFRALRRKCHYTVSSHSLLWSDIALYPFTQYIFSRISRSVLGARKYDVSEKMNHYSANRSNC